MQSLSNFVFFLFYKLWLLEPGQGFSTLCNCFSFPGEPALLLPSMSLLHLWQLPSHQPCSRGCCRSAGTSRTPSATWEHTRRFPLRAAFRQRNPHPPRGKLGSTRVAWRAQAQASAGLRGPSPRLTASTGTSSCGNGRMHSTQLCQANQNPAPKSPSRDNAKGSKRPLLRREWISSTLARCLTQRRSWEQKAHIFRVTREDQSADFPWHCNTQTPCSRA